jgi:hypothetical protein
MSIVLNEYSTEFTTVSDKVECRIDSFGNNGLFRVINATKKLTNIDQINHIIHYLIVTNGFLMEKQTSDEIIFLHPKKSYENFASYTYYPKSMIMVKHQAKFLTYI